mmetsp:Transcript_132613/g.383374  ORF Transcript_132613/g.383374 Transcript_132613/m.383374 type:complete len:243 (+) Transcript_132613:781-1509(+)
MPVGGAAAEVFAGVPTLTVAGARMEGPSPNDASDGAPIAAALCIAGACGQARGHSGAADAAGPVVPRGACMGCEVPVAIARTGAYDGAAPERGRDQAPVLAACDACLCGALHRRGHPPSGTGTCKRRRWRTPITRLMHTPGASRTSSRSVLVGGRRGRRGHHSGGDGDDAARPAAGPCTQRRLPFVVGAAVAGDVQHARAVALCCLAALPLAAAEAFSDVTLPRRTPSRPRLFHRRGCRLHI